MTSDLLLSLVANFDKLSLKLFQSKTPQPFTKKLKNRQHTIGG